MGSARASAEPHEARYNRAMDEPTFTALSAWLTQAGLAGMSESES